MAVKSELGPLELAIMQIIWSTKSSTVREIYESLSQERKIALTTISTTMNRLFNKGFLSREVDTGKGGLFYIYKAKETKKHFEKKVSENLADQIIKSYGNKASMKIVQEISKNYSNEELDNLLEELEHIKKSKNGETN
ncbi:MAG: BlaI/MecI/CopY family transcriptional regulator [Candidatus Lokiarchaeota archaeon]|nr:BlaI/MecI/CopY family transcriptional regulator [Candidatus Lokiarchaeota archaeon]